MPFFLIIIFIFLTEHFLTLMFTEDHNCLKIILFNIKF